MSSFISSSTTLLQKVFLVFLLFSCRASDFFIISLFCLFLSKFSFACCIFSCSSFLTFKNASLVLFFVCQSISFFWINFSLNFLKSSFIFLVSFTASSSFFLISSLFCSSSFFQFLDCRSSEKHCTGLARLGAIHPDHCR